MPLLVSLVVGIRRHQCEFLMYVFLVTVSLLRREARGSWAAFISAERKLSRESTKEMITDLLLIYTLARN